jgi:glycosyltransferase involved in cell wall biosynthesis
VKVAFVIPAYAPAVDYGGPAAKAVSLSHALQDLGVAIEVWTSDFGFGRTRIAPGTCEVDGITVRYLPRLTSYRWSPVVPAVLGLARRTDVDLAHIFGYRDRLTLLAGAALRRRGVPYLVEMAGMTVPRYRNRAIKLVFDRVIGQRYINHAALVVANSLAEAHDVRAYVPPHRINLVYNPIELAVPESRQAHHIAMTGSLRVASIGRLAPVKNLELLARAVAQVPEVELDIIGPTDVREVESNLRAFIASARLEDRIRLRGPLFGDALRSALEQVDVVAMPSQSESFGNAAIEAVVQGIPVIVSDACGVAPLIHDADAGLVVPANDEAALADAIRRLHDDRQLLARLSSVGPQLRSMVAPREIASQHVARYERILSGAPPLPGPFSG